MKFDRRLWWFWGSIFRRRYVRMGLRSYLGPTIFAVCTRAQFSMGDRVRIMAGARIEVLGKGSIKVLDNTSVGHGLTLTCTDENLTIGSNCVISGNVFIGSQNYDFKKERSSPTWFSEAETEEPIIIGDNCFIGYGAVILGGTVLGSNCTVGANAVVRGTFSDNSIIK